MMETNNKDNEKDIRTLMISKRILILRTTKTRTKAVRRVNIFLSPLGKQVKVTCPKQYCAQVEEAARVYYLIVPP